MAWADAPDPMYSILIGYNTRPPIAHPHAGEDVTSGTVADERLPNIMYQKFAPVSDVTIPAGYGGVVSTYYEIVSGCTLTIEDGAAFEIM